MDDREFTAGPVPPMHAPWGSQAKDYVTAAGGMLAGPGMALGMGRGVARPVLEGLGGEAIKRMTEEQRGLVMDQVKAFVSQGFPMEAALRLVLRAINGPQKQGMLDQARMAQAAPRKEMLGTGAARKAADAIKGRRRRLDEEEDKATGGKG
jgi:hypothetical protein